MPPSRARALWPRRSTSRGLRGYSIGGTIHIIVNNQIGFTTDPQDARSTLYASDLAKGFEIPIVHVNADDPEACWPPRMALRLSRRFGKDFLIDLVGYRRWGHNEGDEPVFTQPEMYDKITKHPTVRQVWADHLVAEGIVRSRRAGGAPERRWTDWRRSDVGLTDGKLPPEDLHSSPTPRREVETAFLPRRLRAFQRCDPRDCRRASRPARSWSGCGNGGRRSSTTGRQDRLGPCRNAGLRGDPRRRHPDPPDRPGRRARHLQPAPPRAARREDRARRTRRSKHLPEAKASFAVYNSPLSENAALGFEYGYSIHAEGRLVLWEAQFGDFSNGAQVIIDQFIVAAREQVARKPIAGAAAAARLRGSGTGAFQRPSRALPATGGAGQHPRRELHDRGPVLPPAAAASGAA